jgi:hypothetical protein
MGCHPKPSQNCKEYGLPRFRVCQNCRIKIELVSVLTPRVLDLNLPVMGDKSPKATHKQAAQKQAKATAANQKKNSSSSAKQVPKPK